MDLALTGVVIVVMAAILYWMATRMTPLSSRGARPRGLAAYRSPDETGGAVAGLVSALAFTGFLAVFPGALGTSGVSAGGIGVMLGVLFFVLGLAGATRIRGVVAGGAGILGIIASVTGLFEDPGCTGSPLALRAASFLLLALIAGLALFAMVGITGRSILLGPLSIFAGFEVMGFIAGPFGISPFSTTMPVSSVTVALAAAIGFGGLTGFAPRIAIGLGGTAIMLTSIGLTAGLGGCAEEADAMPLVTIASFGAAYFVLNLILTPFRRRRS